VAAPGAPWWQLWAVPLVLGTILALTTLHVQMGHKRRMKRALSGTVTDDLQK